MYEEEESRIKKRLMDLIIKGLSEKVNSLLGTLFLEKNFRSLLLQSLRVWPFSFEELILDRYQGGCATKDISLVQAF